MANAHMVTGTSVATGSWKANIAIAIAIAT